jgi:peptidyl-prolyl cis-trans isomerase B (cyclophilin B)
VENAPADDLYPAGTIAMARAGSDAYSTGSQFFIVYADTTIPADEAGGYTVIGTVTSGLDQLVSEVTAAGVADGSTDGTPAVPTTITSFTLQ